jgi:hypothetical protein
VEADIRARKATSWFDPYLTKTITGVAPVSAVIVANCEYKKRTFERLPRSFQLAV